jgi:hypothetical protein
MEVNRDDPPEPVDGQPQPEVPITGNPGADVPSTGEPTTPPSTGGNDPEPTPTVTGPRRRSVAPPGVASVTPIDPNPVIPPTIVPQPTQPPARAQERELTYNAQNGVEPVWFGEVKNVGAAIVQWNAIPGGKFLVRYVISKGPNEEVSNIRIGGEPISNYTPLVANNATGSISAGYQVYLGTPDQPVSRLMQLYRPGWIPTRHPGICHVVAVFPRVDDGESPPDVTDFLCDLKAMKINDPAQDPTLTNLYFTEDPALIIANLLTSKRYGVRVEKEYINWNLLKDETSPYVYGFLPGTTIRRYPIGIGLVQSQTIQHVIDNIRAHAQLFLSYTGGLYNILADMPREYSGIHFTDANLLEGSRMRMKGSGEVYDRVTVRYTDWAIDSRDNSVEINHPSVSNAYGPLEEGDFPLLGTRAQQQANRIGTYLLKRGRLDKEFHEPVDFFGIKAMPGDRCKLTSSEANVEDLDVIVVDISPTEDLMTWTYHFEQYDESIYNNDLTDDINPIIPANPSPHETPPAPTGLILNEEIYLDGNGVQTSRIVIQYTPADLDYTGGYHRIRYRKTPVGTGVPDPWTILKETNDPIAYIYEARAGDIYNIDIRAVTAPPYNLESAALTGTIVSAAPSSAGPAGPAGPSGKTLTVISNRQTIVYDSSNTLNPPSQVIVFTVQKQNIAQLVNWTVTDITGTPKNAALYLSNTTGDEVTMTEAQFEAAAGTTTGVIVSAYVNEYT